MKTLVIKLVFAFLLSAYFAHGQESNEKNPSPVRVQRMDSLAKKSIWDKKFYWGFTFDNALVSISGPSLPNHYFRRPGVGGSIKAEYFFTKNIGLTAGVAWETRGAGIVTPDYVKELGNPDSTYRARIKFYSVEAPIAIVLRGFQPIKGTRLHAELGVTPSRNVHAKYIFLSIEDGFHLVENHSDRYYKMDVMLHGAFGLDINAANACVFQIHFFGNMGTTNVYNTNYFPGADGKNRLIGLRLGWMF